MFRTTFLLTIVLVAVCIPLAAQPFEGSFSSTNGQGAISLMRLTQSGSDVTGTLWRLGSTIRMDGEIEGSTVVGAMAMGQDERLQFEIEIEGDDLLLTLVSVSLPGEPDVVSETTMRFVRRVPNPMDGMGKTSGRAIVIGHEPESDDAGK